MTHANADTPARRHGRPILDQGGVRHRDLPQIGTHVTPAARAALDRIEARLGVPKWVAVSAALEAFDVVTDATE